MIFHGFQELMFEGIKKEVFYWVLRMIDSPVVCPFGWPLFCITIDCNSKSSKLDMYNVYVL